MDVDQGQVNDPIEFEPAALALLAARARESAAA